MAPKCMEVKHANGFRRSAPFLPDQRVLVKNLWEKLSQQTRQQALQTLSQIVARQLLPEDQQEVRDEDG